MNKEKVGVAMMWVKSLTTPDKLVPKIYIYQNSNESNDGAPEFDGCSVIREAEKRNHETIQNFQKRVFRIASAEFKDKDVVNVNLYRLNGTW